MYHSLGFSESKPSNKDLGAGSPFGRRDWKERSSDKGDIHALVSAEMPDLIPTAELLEDHGQQASEMHHPEIYPPARDPDRSRGTSQRTHLSSQHAHTHFGLHPCLLSGLLHVREHWAESLRCTGWLTEKSTAAVLKPVKPSKMLWYRQQGQAANIPRSSDT